LATVIQGTSAFDALLQRCRDLALSHLDAALDAMLEKADERLAEELSKTQAREKQKLLMATRDVVRTRSQELQKQFHQRFLAEFQQRANKARQLGGSFDDADIDHAGLSLVDEEDLEETIRFDELAEKLRRSCDDEVNALDQRVGVLVGDADLEADANPLGPKAVCDAFKQSCQRSAEDGAVRAVLLRLFEAHMNEAIVPMYEALNDLLVQNAILPKIRYGGPKKDRKAKGKKDGDSADNGEQDLFAMLQKLAANQGGDAAGGSGVGGAPLIQGVELLNSLTQLQLDGLAALAASGGQLPSGAEPAAPTNVLHELKASQVGAGMGQVDAMTLDVVAMLFDQLFDDPKIPLGAKGLIGRMQIPVLKVAIADKTFFKKKDHEARLLLDTLGEIAIRLPADFNTGSALYGQLETIIQGLISEYKDDVAIFRNTREQLVALMSQEDKRVEDEAREAAQRVLQEEALAVAKSAAQSELGARLQTVNVPGAVVEFLAEQWLRLMMLIHVRRGPDSDQWKHALEVVDNLIWSVQPKEDTDERRKLAKAVPTLLKSLASGLKACGVDDSVREAFFAHLMRFHTAIMSVSPKDEAPPEPGAPGDKPQSLDFTAPITIRNPFGEGDVQVSGIDVELEGDGKSGRRRWDPDNPDNLQHGDWLQFTQPADAPEGKPPLPVRLIFISPRKTRYIFCDRGEKEYIQCTRAEIARRLRTGEAVVMEEAPEVPFFERIMEGVMGRLKRKAA